MFHLNDTIAWVTGASRGLGEGISYALRHAGAIVIDTSCYQPEAQRIAIKLNTLAVEMNITH